MRVGKLVRGALYVHRDAIYGLAEDTQAMIDRAVGATGSNRWNVARVEKYYVGLLEYEDFDAAAFPRLISSTRVNLATREHRRTDFSRSANPLILHRKEQLMMPHDPRVGRWAETTRMLVSRGVFGNSHLIGRKCAWDEMLAHAELTAVGDQVLPA